MSNIYEYIKSEEAAYKLGITVTEGYEWSMYEHIKRTILYKNSQFLEGTAGVDDKDHRPFKNITLPILRLEYRSEGFDVKDILLYANDVEKYYLSFLLRKYHTRFALKNNLDTFIDEMVESYCDFGAVIVKDVNGIRPEVVNPASIAFCDQSDFLSGPFAIKHAYNPDQLKEMEKNHWGDPKFGATMTIDDLITHSENHKKNVLAGAARETKTPGKYIEIYEVHGIFKDEWLEPIDDTKTETVDQEKKENQYSQQLHIVGLYVDRENNKQGVTLFKGPEKKFPFKIKKRDPIFGRAFGLGGAEELFDPQMWTNYTEIQIKELLDAASKTIYQTTDTAFAGRNKTTDLDNGEILIHEPNAPITQIQTTPTSMVLFERAVSSWDARAKELASASPALLGTAPSNHTSFAFQRLITQQATAIHDYRRGQLATFMGEIYRDWIIPYMSREILSGQKFVTELTGEELNQVADSLVACRAGELEKEKVFAGQPINPQEIDQFKQQVRQEFMKRGQRWFLEILKGEMKDVELDVQVTIAGKQKDLQVDLASLKDIFAQIIANPKILQDPSMAKIFNKILEYSHLDPMDFYMPPDTNADKAQNKVSESLSYKDAPEDVKRQIEVQAGLKPSQMQQSPQPQPAGALK